MLDPARFDPLLETVHRFFMNKVSSTSDADDCTQQTFERLLDRDTAGDIANLEAFAYGIARNVLHEYWRAQARLLRNEDVGELSIAQMGAGVSTIINLQQWQQLLYDALRTLRLDHQIVLELHYWENKKYDEIAELIGVPAGTVATWLRRGRKALSERLEVVAAQEGGKHLDPQELERCLERLRNPADDDGSSGPTGATYPPP